MLAVQEIESVWDRASSFLYVPHTEAQYRDLVALLDELTDEVGEDETNPLASLMEIIGTLIEKYEDENVPELTA